MDSLFIGQIIHYILEQGPSKGQTRPAMILSIVDQEKGIVDLQVFGFGPDDGFALQSLWSFNVPLGTKEMTWQLIN